MGIIGKNRRTNRASPSLKCSLCSLSLCGICSSSSSRRACTTGQARLSSLHHSEPPHPGRWCFCNPGRLASSRGALQTQAVALKRTPRQHPRWPLLLKVKLLRCQSHVSYFPHFHLLPDEGLRVASPAALASVCIVHTCSLKALPAPSCSSLPRWSRRQEGGGQSWKSRMGVPCSLCVLLRRGGSLAPGAVKLLLGTATLPG